MTNEENLWLPLERAKLLGGSILNVKSMSFYVSRIQPKYSTIAQEASFCGSDSSLLPSAIESRIIDGFRDNPQLLNHISKVFIYFNGNNSESAKGSGPLRYFLYAGNSQPVDIVADSNPGLTQKVIQAAHLDREFQHNYRVNFAHNSQEENINPKYKYKTKELSVSRSVRNTLKQTILKYFVS